MVDCDVVYYKLHYMDLTRMSPTTAVSHYSIPHLIQYFGEVLPEVTEAKQRVAATVSNMISVSFSEDMTLVSNCFWESTTREQIDEDNEVGIEKEDVLSRLQKEDVLSRLHHTWFLKAIQLFYCSGWLDNTKQRMKGFVKAGIDHQYHHNATGHHHWDEESYQELLHKTPAPPILKAWRDSCCDFLMHLYSYATISQCTLKRMKDFIGTDWVVEVGVGTRYLAKLLHDDGIQVAAYVSWPGAQNSYHGATPPFLPLEAGDASKVIA